MSNTPNRKARIAFVAVGNKMYLFTTTFIFLNKL